MVLSFAEATGAHLLDSRELEDDQSKALCLKKAQSNNRWADSQASRILGLSTVAEGCPHCLEVMEGFLEEGYLC